MPGSVVSGGLLSRDGRRVILSVEGPHRPRELWCLSTRTLQWTRVGAVPFTAAHTLVEPELIRYRAHDGLELSAWLYRVPGRSEPGPAMLSLHGGPEAQERPVFSPQHQAMAAAGIAVLAPNIRGSSGFGRAFVHADDVHGRRDAFEDVITSADELVRLGIADPRAIAVTGRSYGGYLTLACLAFYPGYFAAGVDICGMSDLHTFYRDTEPWIAAAAVSKYGDPVADAALLAAISPLHRAENIQAPLLVVHGELDTNVPIGEAHQIVTALRDLGREVDYLQLDGEGHEYRRTDSRIRLITTMLEFLTETLQ
jgi:dipeptidyl aminopeptidase/acylaminoacyl peptidase